MSHDVCELPNSDEEAFVFIANDILRKCKINGEFLESLAQCSDSFFVAVYEGILGEPLKGIIPEAVSHEDKVHNCVTVIDALSCDVLNVDLSHISAEDIVNGDISTIQNLLEIFKELLDFILDVDDEEEGYNDQDDQNDSNLLSSDHEVISDVLNQELRSSYGNVCDELPEKPLDEERTPVHTPLSDHPTIEVDISMIPKWNKSHVSSSRSSGCDSNSTDEIIRESEIIEQELAREYPSLHKSRDLEEGIRRSRKMAEEKTRKKLPSKVENGKVTSKRTVKNTRRTEPEKERIFFDKTDDRLPNDQLTLTDLSSSRDPVGSQGTPRDFRNTGYPTTSNYGSEFKGGQRTVGDRRGTGIENMGLRDFDDAVKDTRETGTRTTDSKGTSSAFRESRSKQTKTRETEVFAKETELPREEINIHGTIRSDYTWGERGTFGYTRELQGNFREPDVFDKYVPQSRQESTTTKNVSQRRLDPGVSNGARQHRTSENHGKNSTVRDNRASSHCPTTRGVGRSEGKSGLNEVAENRLKSDENLYRRFDFGSKQATYNDEKERRSHMVSERLIDERGNKGITGRVRKDKDILVREQPSGRMIDAARPDVDDVVSSMKNSEIETRKLSTQTRPLGIDREQHGSMLKRGDHSDNYEKRIPRTEQDGDVGSSDTSAVLWDDQISPLDASEQGIGSKMAFDKVGTGERRISEKMGKDRDKSGDRSSVFRHYHHHFHHPHGSSEDLVKDLENATRGERNQEGRTRSTKSRGSTQNKRSSDCTGKVTSRNESHGKRSVKFNDNVEMVLITNRLERLKKELENDEKEQHDRRLYMKSSYGGHLDYLNNEREKIEKQLNQVPKAVTKPKPRRLKRGARRVPRDHGTAHAIYGKSTGKKARFPSSKARKRSTSSSPKIRQRKKTAKQMEKGDVILPTMLEEFPFLHLSPHTMQTMRRKQTEQLMALSKSSAQNRQTKTQKVMEDAERRQETLLKILRKDLLHNQRMREQKERSEQERAIKSKLREKRQASARARRYYEDYQLRMRARLLKRRTREEQIFKNLFEDGLAIQKQRVNELRSYAKEQREVRAKRQQSELESLENYYRDQYSILAETISREKEALQVREKAQEKVIHQMQRNLREKLQKEVVDIQETLVRDEDDAHFRRLDAERLRKQMQMTAFQNFS